jgi:hypothetical protein
MEMVGADDGMIALIWMDLRQRKAWELGKP